MINEVLVVENLLNGIGINKRNCLYQHCLLLARYYLQQGCNQFHTRKKILAWGRKYKIEIDSSNVNLNQLIYKANEESKKLRDDVVVRVSNSDVQEIIDRFDKERVRKVALAVLCWAKISADANNCFVLPVSGLANWLGYSYTYTHERYLPELIGMGYLEKLETKDPRRSYTWQNAPKIPPSSFKLLVPFVSSGEYQLKDNDIDALYDDCISNKNWTVRIK